MSSSGSKPVILFVHGAWHSPDIQYGGFVEVLRNAGYEVVAPTMPTLNGDKPPTKNLPDDASFIHDIAKQLVEAGSTVLVLCHSYGGMVTTNAMTEDLSVESRKAKGQAGGIARLIYLCAFIPQKGVSILSVVMGSSALLDVDVDDKGNAFPKNPMVAFYEDVEKGLAQSMSYQLITHPISAQMTEATNDGWKHYPLTYIFCTQDRAIVIEKQQEMVEKVRQAGVKDLVTETLDASHSPFMSMPEKTLEAVNRACQLVA